MKEKVLNGAKVNQKIIPIISLNSVKQY